MQVPATTAGFLVQSTTVITPALAFVSGETISNRTWSACAVAAFGTVLVTADGLSESSSLAGALAGGSMTGKLTVLSAALFYSLGTFRLSQLSPGMCKQSTSASLRLHSYVLCKRNSSRQSCWCLLLYMSGNDTRFKNSPVLTYNLALVACQQNVQ